MAIQENWLPIKGYEDLYEVSDQGNVRSIDRMIFQQGRFQRYKGSVISPFKNNGGYLCVRISKDNKKKSFTVHRLVAEAFIPNPNNLPQINHKNEDKTCNSVENLEWCDCRYNLMYGTLPEKRKSRCCQTICMYDKHGRFVRSIRSARDAERELGISHSTILDCCKGKAYSAGGFIWRFKRDTNGEPIKPQTHAKMPREVDQYDLHLNFIASYKSIHAAAKANGCNAEGVGVCCRTVGKTCGGYYWAFKGAVPKKKSSRKVIKYDLQMNFVEEFDSLTDACNSIGGNSKRAGMKQCIYGKNKQAYGYIWKYAD